MLPTFDSKTPIPQLEIALANTTAPLPWNEDNHATIMQAEPVQPARDIYSGAPALGSDADQQQWLCTELYNSLHLREFSFEVGQWDSTGGFRSPCQLKQLALNEVAMHTYLKKARTCLKMQLTHFYYSKCCMNNADHSYKQCLT